MLDNYFIEFNTNLGYLELKEKSSYELLNNIPLPIYVKDMKDKIIDGSLSEKIDINLIIEGMLINIAIDRDFMHNEKYKEIIKYYIKNIGDYTAQKALESLDYDFEKSLLILRSGYILDSSNKFNSYNYARLLWPKAYDEKIKNPDEFIKESLKILQHIIAQDEDFAIAYYELGNIYTNLGEYLKARIYYNKALAKTDSPIVKDEIRDKLREIEDNAEIEQALYYIGKSNYNQAIITLTGILSKSIRADAYYYLGVAYQNISQYENSIMAFANAIKEHAEFRELYNDYAISLYMNKEDDKALEIIEEGLEKYPEDPRLIYNKIQINLSMGNIKQAKKDIDNLLTYDDLSDEIRYNLNVISEQFKIK